MTNNKTVLIISSNHSQFALFSSLMRDEGFCPLFANDAVQGLKIARADLPKLIIAELAMSNVDGLELCRRVRKDRTMRSTPILILGDLSRDSSIAEDALYCGANDYFQKPFDQVALFERCASMIEIECDDSGSDRTDSIFRLLIENVSDIISILSEDGTILFESPSVERALGYKPNELAGGSAFDLIHPDDVAAVVDMFHRAVKTLSTSPLMEYRFRHKDGSWKYIESIGKPFKDPKHGLSIVVTSRDTTERRIASEAKRKSDGRLKTIFEEAATGIAIVTTTGKLVQCNPALQRMLGYTADELLTLSINDFTHPDDIDNDMALLNEIFEGQRHTYQLEKRYITKTGGIVIGRLTVSAILDENRKPEFVIRLIEDISEQTETGILLRKSQEHLGLAQQAAQIGSFEFDLRNQKAFCSPELEAIFGVAPKTLNHATDEWINLIHPEDVHLVTKEIEQAMSTGNHESEVRIVRPDGDTRWMYSKGKVFFEPDGSPSRIVGVNMDVTERKLVEQDLIESKVRLQRQNLVLKELYKNQTIFGGDLEEAVREITRISSTTIETERVSVWLFSDDKSKIEVLDLYEATPNRHSNGLEFITADFPSYFCALENETSIVVSEAYDDPRTSEFVKEYLPNNQIGSMLDAPIRLGGKVVGVICHEHVGGNRDWTLDEQNFAGSMADLLSLILESKERIDVEKALRYQKQINESLIHSIEGIVWEAEINPLKFTFVSKQAERLLGYPTERWTDEPDFWASSLHPDDRESIVNFCAEASAKLENHEFDYRIIAADGRVVWLHDIVTVDASDMNNIRLRGVMVDVTQSKEAEALQARANEKAIAEYIRLVERLATLGQKLGGARDLNSVFQSIIEFTGNSVPCSRLTISLFDSKENIQKPIYLWSDGKELDASELKPTGILDGPVKFAIDSGDIQVTKGCTDCYTYESEISRDWESNGTSKSHSAIISPMKVMGKVIGVMELLSDGTESYTDEHATAIRMAANLTANAIENIRLIEMEQVRAEQFRLSQQLESVGRLAGGIAHDFNNMLTAINGYSDLTLRKLKLEDPLNIRKNIEEIKKAGERSAALTQQLLAFSRRQVMQPRVIDINHTVEETGTLLERLIGEDIELVLSLSSEIGRVEADPGILTQVIMNLAVNARDAMPDGGRLTIETSNQFLDEDYESQHDRMKTGAYVMLAISDTGGGMSSEVKGHIFEPFFTTKAVGKGTGLGLATVYGVVKQSGGYIWVYSEIGQGATFKIYLPRVDAEPTETLRGSDYMKNVKGTETIFLVEDEETVRKLSKQILESCGYSVIEARNGAEAVEVCKNSTQHYDLLLTDVVMPKMSGRQLVKHMTSMRPGIKVLYMSGYTDDSVLRNGVIAAGENFIQKPFTFNTLAEQVREMLDFQT